MYPKTVKSSDIPRINFFHWQDHRNISADPDYPTADLYLKADMSSRRIREMVYYMFNLKKATLSEMSEFIQGDKKLRGSLSLVKDRKRNITGKQTQWKYYQGLRDCYWQKVARVVHFEQQDRNKIMTWVKQNELHFDVYMRDWNICFKNTLCKKGFKDRCVCYNSKNAAGYGWDGIIFTWKKHIYAYRYKGDAFGGAEKVGAGTIGQI